jgi:hypothetical protein
VRVLRHDAQSQGSHSFRISRRDEVLEMGEVPSLRMPVRVFEIEPVQEFTRAFE